MKRSELADAPPLRADRSLNALLRIGDVAMETETSSKDDASLQIDADFEEGAQCSNSRCVNLHVIGPFEKWLFARIRNVTRNGAGMKSKGTAPS